MLKRIAATSRGGEKSFSLLVQPVRRLGGHANSRIGSESQSNGNERQPNGPESKAKGSEGQLSLIDGKRVMAS